jgi:hypothetical protein
MRPMPHYPNTLAYLAERESFSAATLGLLNRSQLIRISSYCGVSIIKLLMAAMGQNAFNIEANY